MTGCTVMAGIGLLDELLVEESSIEHIEENGGPDEFVCYR